MVRPTFFAKNRQKVGRKVLKITQVCWYRVKYTDIIVNIVFSKKNIILFLEKINYVFLIFK
jgi:hypothetical protein